MKTASHPPAESSRSQAQPQPAITPKLLTQHDTAERFFQVPPVEPPYPGIPPPRPPRHPWPGDPEFPVDIADTIIDNPDNDADLLLKPDVEPEFPGGNEAMKRFLLTHVKYPDLAKEAGIEGVVWIEFTVNTDGSLSDVVAINQAHPELKQEAVRVVKTMPNWQPGKTKGEPVRCRHQLSIRFTLQ